MSSKLGLLLTLAFAIQVLCFMGDLACLQALVGRLDAYAISLSKEIAILGGINRDLQAKCEADTGALLRPVSGYDAEIGELYEFKLLYRYVPISFLEPFVVTLTRSTVIGYLN